MAAGTGEHSRGSRARPRLAAAGTQAIRNSPRLLERPPSSGRYEDGEVLAVVEPVPDEAGADDGGVLAEVVVGVTVGEVVGADVVGVGVGVGVVDLVGVGVGVTLAGGGVYAGALDEALCVGVGDELLGALDEGAGAEDVTAAGMSLSRAGVCLVAEVTTKTAAPMAPSITPMISASMSGRTRRRRGWFPPPGGPYMPPGGVGGVFPSGDVADPYPIGGVVGP